MRKIVSSFSGTRAFEIGKTLHRTVHEAAAPIHHKLRARKPAGIDISPLQMVIEALERGAGHP
jgi:hypothetical protein